jgi:hypothetical protein
LLAVGAGTVLAAPYNADPLGKVRGGDGVWDCGACEYGSGDVTPPPPEPPDMIMTVVWAGAMVAPAQLRLEPFWPVWSVSFVAGIPPISTLVAPMRWRRGPIIPPEITPPTTPALSPLLIGTMVWSVWAGVALTSTFFAAVPGLAVAPSAILG